MAEHDTYLSPCDDVTCTVATCKYNAQNICQLEDIQVNSEEDVTIYTQTDCSSFEAR